MMKRAILVAVVAVIFLPGLSAQDKPNFAGAWQMPNSPIRWTITVDGNRMTVTQTVAGNPFSVVYMLDGTPSKNIPCPGCTEAIFTSKWDGNVLVTSMSTTPNPIVEKRSIEADGSMKVERTLMVQGQPRTSPPQLLKKIA